MPARITEPAVGASTASAETMVFPVAAGDTLWGIAKRFDVTVEALIAANPGIDPLHLREGQNLRVPTSLAAVAASAQGMTSFCDDPDRAVSVTEQYVPDLADATQAAHAREVAVATAALVRPTEDAVVGLVTVDEVSATIEFLTEHGLTGPTTVDAEDVCVPLLTA